MSTRRHDTKESKSRSILIICHPSNLKSQSGSGTGREGKGTFCFFSFVFCPNTYYFYMYTVQIVEPSFSSSLPQRTNYEMSIKKEVSSTLWISLWISCRKLSLQYAWQDIQQIQSTPTPTSQYGHGRINFMFPRSFEWRTFFYHFQQPIMPIFKVYMGNYNFLTL